VAKRELSRLETTTYDPPWEVDMRAMIRAGLADVRVRVVTHHALASEPLFDTYRLNWLDTVSGLHEILGARFDAGLVDAARRELERRGADDFRLELTVLASGTKAA